VRHIATGESEIELKRQDIAQSPAFVHSEAFNAISGFSGKDADKDEGEEK